MIRTVMGFSAVGVANTVLSYAVFAGLIAAGLHHTLAATAGWLASLPVGFVLHKRVTFSLRTEANRREVWLFAVGSVLQLVIGVAGIALAIEVLSLGTTFAYVATLAATCLFSFVFMKRRVFQAGPA